jgi:hypothetical protein
MPHPSAAIWVRHAYQLMLMQRDIKLAKRHTPGTAK